MASMEDQINNTDDYSYRLDEDPITMGCYLGGTLRYEPVDGGTKLTLEQVRVHPGRADDRERQDRRRRRHVPAQRPSSSAGTGSNYFDNADGVKSVRGTYRGQPVNLKR